MNAQKNIKRIIPRPNKLSALTGTLLAFGSRVMVLLAAVILTATFAQAANLLSNGDFNSPNSTAAPTGWTTWTYGGGGPWVEHQIVTSELGGNAGIYDNTYMMKLGVFNGTGMASVYQIVGGGPNASYTLTCDSGMQAWWLMYGEIRLIFLDASSAEISRNVVRTTDSLHNEYNGGLGDQFDVGVVMQRWTNSAVSPAGTAFVKVEFEVTGANGGNCWFDNAELTSPLVPPVIANIYPNGAVLQQATNTLSFTATSALDITNIVVVLNGVNVSGNLVVSGPPTSRIVSYTNLQPNRVYTAAITVTDAGNLSTPATVNFDTYTPVFSWEAEDYDYGSGQFINHPTPSGAAAAGSYFGLIGTAGVDFHDRGGNGTHAYRASDGMAAEATSDQPRNGAAPDFNVGWFDGAGFPSGDSVGIANYDAGEWVNYTRDFPAGTYNIVGRVANGNGGTATIPLSKVISGWGTSSQATTELGAFRFPANGWGSYAYVPLTDKNGNRIAVTLSGTNTLRVTAGSGGNLNFFMLVAVNTEQPTITGVYPDGSTLVQGTNQLTFTVSSASHSIAQTNVTVTLNGLTNHSLAFSGSTSSWHVSLPLALNVTNYTAVISVTDDLGNSHSITRYFDTFDPASFAFEAENFDFSSGQFIDNAVITSGPAGNSYFDQISTDGTDSSYGDVLNVSAPFRWRSADTISTDVCSDTKTRELVAAQLTNSLAFNYNIAYWATNAWLNYTRTYPAGKFKVYARLAGEWGLTNQIQLDQITNSSSSYLGTFTEVGRGYGAFDWIPLVDTNTSQLVTLTLGGVATLRTTSVTGNVNPNSYLLVPAVTVPEPLQHSYSAGVLTLIWIDSAFHLQVQTNGLTGTWVNYPGGTASPVLITNNPANGAVFFRLSN